MNSGGVDVLKYPVSVFLDTNIFISCRYDFSENGSLYLLKKYASDNKVKIYISNIVYREVEKHIRFDVLQAIRSFKKAQEEASKALSQNILLNFSSLLSKKCLEIFLKIREQWI
jgi:predicted nucleic acid-binding protein